MKFTSLLVVSMIAGLTTAPVLAQSTGGDRPERPSRAIFGRPSEPTRDLLAVTGSAGGGFDSNPALDPEAVDGLTGPRLSGEGSVYSTFEGGVVYARNTGRLEVGTSVSGSGRHYAQSTETFTTSYSGVFGAALALGATRLAGNQSVSYQSRRAFFPFPTVAETVVGAAVAPDLDLVAGFGSFRSHRTAAELSHPLSRRTSFAVAYGRETTAYDIREHSLRTQSASLRIRHGLTRGIGVRLGYGLADSRYEADGTSFKLHNIDAGLDFARDLSLTRRTRLSFSSGATALKENNAIRYDVVGSATLTHEIGRTWALLLFYNRNVGYSPAVRLPFFYDGVNTSLRGLLTRRIEFESSGGATFGNEVGGADSGKDGFATWYGTSGVNFALTRNLALGVTYMFYNYDVEQSALLAPGVATKLNRHSVRVSFNAWVPLVERRRRSDAAR